MTHHNWNGSKINSFSYDHQYADAVELKSAIEMMMPNKVSETKESTNNSSMTEELTRLNELLKSGVISEEEFSKAKEKLLT